PACGVEVPIPNLPFIIEVVASEVSPVTVKLVLVAFTNRVEVANRLVDVTEVPTALANDSPVAKKSVVVADVIVNPPFIYISPTTCNLYCGVVVPIPTFPKSVVTMTETSSASINSIDTAPSPD